MRKDGGGPAFPSSEKVQEWNEAKGQYGQRVYATGGMSLRDYFAITLLAGDARDVGDGCTGYMKQRARVAYDYADAMLLQRGKQLDKPEKETNE